MSQSTNGAVLALVALVSDFLEILLREKKPFSSSCHFKMAEEDALGDNGLPMKKFSGRGVFTVSRSLVIKRKICKF